MTSINALRLDHHSGLLICDEARYWNPEWMIFYTPEKIRRIVNENITKARRSVMFMGQTGTSSIGDEWIAEITRTITSEYEKALESNEGRVDALVRMPALARLAFKRRLSRRKIPLLRCADWRHGAVGGRSLLSALPVR
ncbi:MAG TPA: hypothetical protein PLV45_11470 [bacterium]|nr:hypothetical protein [bacterium]